MHVHLHHGMWPLVWLRRLSRTMRRERTVLVLHPSCRSFPLALVEQQQLTLLIYCQTPCKVCLATPFLNLYLQDRGLSQQQIGIMGAMRPWVGVPASFMWAAGADYFKAHR